MNIKSTKAFLEVGGLAVALVSGVLALGNQYYDLFWSFDRAPELLLVICCGGLAAFGARLFLRKSESSHLPIRNVHGTRAFMKQSGSRHWPIRFAGLAILILVPVLGLLFWYGNLHLSAQNRIAFDQHRSMAEGYEAMGSEYLEDAIAEYEAAKLIAPWKGSIRQKLRELKAERLDQKRGDQK